MSTKSHALFTYQQDSLFFNGHALSDHAAIKNYQQPVLMHDPQLVQERINWVKEWKGLGQLHFALKSNYDETILKLIQENGCGVDVVSLGEIQLALRCGFKPQDILFSGVAKTEKEIRWAIENEIYQLNVESIPELRRIQKISNQLMKSIHIGLRLNPEVDAKTHPNIATALQDSKFGLNTGELAEVEALLKKSAYIILKSISFHIGSQVMDTSIYREAILKMKPIYLDVKSRFHTLDRFDLGGGLGLNYRDHDMTHDYERWTQLRKIYEQDLADMKDHFLIEIGRFMVARSAVLIAQVQYIKKTKNKTIIILDVGMNNLLRPMLYQAYHQIYPLKQRAGKQSYMVVGPLCESSDVFHESIELNIIQEGDFVAIADAGAYTKSMASNYNLQPIATDHYLTK
ncbi:MAG: diaminopimelate decarboxylase [Bdellovibrionaceae bacterium]|nr:diaminopimelate decarboxylase [Pseudobdellovibrionaceae bacterium]